MKFSDVVNLLVNEPNVDISIIETIAFEINDILPSGSQITLAPDMSSEDLLEAVSNLPLNLRIIVYEMVFNELPVCLCNITKTIYKPTDTEYEEVEKESIEECDKKDEESDKDIDGMWLVLVAVGVLIFIGSGISLSKIAIFILSVFEAFE